MSFDENNNNKAALWQTIIIIIWWIFSPFSLAEGPPRDLQITTYK